MSRKVDLLGTSRKWFVSSFLVMVLGGMADPAQRHGSLPYIHPGVLEIIRPRMPVICPPPPSQLMTQPICPSRCPAQTAGPAGHAGHAPLPHEIVWAVPMPQTPRRWAFHTTVPGCSSSKERTERTYAHSRVEPARAAPAAVAARGRSTRYLIPVGSVKETAANNAPSDRLGQGRECLEWLGSGSRRQCLR